MSEPSRASGPVSRDKKKPVDWGVDEELEQASLEVDQSLIRWSLGLSIRERLRAASRTARMLGRFHRVGAP